MNWVQFKDPVCFICLAGAVVAPWSPAQEMAGSSPFNDKYFDKYIFFIFLINKNIYGKTSI